MVNFSTDLKTKFVMVSALYLVLLGACTGVVTCEIYTSSYQIQQLATKEEELVGVIQKYITREEKRLKELKTFIRDVKRNLTTQASRHSPPKRNLTKQASRHSPSTEDPISSLLLLKRFEATWSRKVETLSNQTNLKQTLRNINILIGEFPTAVDVDGATNGVIRLQKTYKISASTLKNRSPKNITATDAFRLAEAGFQQGVSEIAADWLTEALLLKHPGPEWAAARKEMVDSLIASAAATEQQQTKHTCVATVDKIANTNGRSNVSKSSQSDNGAGGGRCVKLEGYTRAEENQFFNLCRGDQYGKSVGLCKYRWSTIPYKRWEEEILSQDPYIVMFHHVISDSELHHLKNISINLLERSGVGQPGKGVVAEARTSKVAWLWDNHTNIVRDLSRRVTDITRLCTEYRDSGSCAEPLQVLNYGIGGQYQSHYDFHQNDSLMEKTASFIRDSGDRLATFMFYLSDVAEGGATVFPEIGVRIPPIKGSAAFWYNFKNGKRDWRTKHGGCPVLKGDKWVANKWIHEIAGFG